MKKKIGIIGCGGIATEVGKFIFSELNQHANVSVIYDIDKEKALSLKKLLNKKNIKIVSSMQEVVENCDIVLETAVGEIVRELLTCCVKQKKDVILLSIGGIFSCEDMIPAINKAGISVYHPSGAIAGVDGVYAASYSKIEKLILTTSKPPQGIIGQKDIKKTTVLFSGSAKEAYKLFPRNINVAATLFIASRFEDLKVIIKVDPKIKRNVHRIELKSDIVNMITEVENLPLKSNPKTSAMAAASTKALLAKMFASIKVGV